MTAPSHDLRLYAVEDCRLLDCVITQLLRAPRTKVFMMDRASSHPSDTDLMNFPVWTDVALLINVEYALLTYFKINLLNNAGIYLRRKAK